MPRHLKEALWNAKLLRCGVSEPYGQDAEPWGCGYGSTCSVQRGYEKEGGSASANFGERKGDP